MSHQFNFNNKYINNFPKLVSFLSLVFLLGALWYEGLYYGFFGINIFTYISLSDAISLFIDRLLLMIIISGGVFLCFMIFQVIFSGWLAKLLHVSRYNTRIRQKRLTTTMLILFFIGILPMMLFMVFIPTIFPGSHRTEEFLLIRAIIFLFAIFWFSYISFSYERGKYETTYFSPRAAVVTLLITFFVVIYYYYRWQVFQIKEPMRYGESSYKITLQNNSVINCVDSIKMIGKTKDYIFLVYPENAKGELSTVKILMMSEIKEISIERYMPWYSVFP